MKISSTFLSGIHIELQVELVFSLIIITALCLFFIYAGKKVMAADPLEKPKGIVLVCETGVEMVYNYMKSIMPSQFEKSYYPYFAMLFVYLIVANLSGLIGFDAPTSNYSITLAMTLITFILIQYNAFKKKGGLTYIKELVWPPTNILSAISPLISLSMRLFGNILSGTILMGLVYQFTGWLSGMILPVNFLGPILAPVLHAYFDVFAGCIQTLVFVTLSSILIAIEAE
ncbi:MAG: F0F1 ATP synthase subunit A [Longibaculum muris]|uniref:ATP synthase subunit a n=1 Tax=Longibaculum muris TaxID=1796628 RepID=A0A4R3YSC1_9FIRM|nr:F0F1 ATP synthase subunit A [Longibaculum muris]KXU44548.1 ATP synthase F0, A subunit [Candidatus Stoquefichus sp. KLE1796]MBS5370617.1 F0F1 ATP synthase subunit A [Coprobacillus cateniformis]MCR1888039.1 F0F1 ATP synthase subunit A [Longibaculum muris]MED9811693.1 F0F1 ATP synthase subunit A [Longibaculum muris]TCV95381.1 F-type H+-transporting ATPase subunit a [Longibaculum muris]